MIADSPGSDQSLMEHGDTLWMIRAGARLILVLKKE